MYWRLFQDCLKHSAIDSSKSLINVYDRPQLFSWLPNAKHRLIAQKNSVADMTFRLQSL